MKYSEIKTQFTLGHITVVAVAVVILGGLTMVHQWDRVSGYFDEVDVVADASTSLYYPYVAPVVPQVLGDDTIPDGPSVLGEDGKIATLNNLGDVLGATSEDVQIDIDAIKVKTVADTAMDMELYWDKVFLVESVITPGDFETTLTSNDEAKIAAQVEKFKSVQTELRNMEVPERAKTLQQLKIAQYDAASNLLSNFYQINSNAEYVSSHLTLFMGLQQKQETEAQKLLK